MEEKKINFYQIPLKIELEEVMKGRIEDSLLHRAAKEYSEELAAQNIETWVTEGNILITEGGYIVALYDEESLKEPEDQFAPNEEKYINALERIVKHFLGVTMAKKLQGYFSPEIINDALLVKNIINGRRKHP